jgi:hypothetical protein
MKKAHIVGINFSRLSYVTDVRAFRRLFTMKWTLVKSISFGLFATCAAFLLYASSSSTRDLIIKTFDSQILLAGLIALILIALLSCIVFFSQVSFIDIHDDEPKDGSVRRYLYYFMYPFRFVALCLVGTTHDAKSMFLDKQEIQGRFDDGNAVDPELFENIQDELRKLNEISNDKMDRLFEMVTILKART